MAAKATTNGKVFKQVSKPGNYARHRHKKT